MGPAYRKLFPCTVAALLIAVSATSLAQPPKHALIGYMDSSSGATGNWGNAISGRLTDLGWSEGRNLTIERRYTAGKHERLVDLASEFVRLKVAVIVVAATFEAQAVQKVTRSVPVVVMVATDPLEGGLAKSLARPGANVTGIVFSDAALVGKQVQLIKEISPGVKRIGWLDVAGRGRMDSFQQALESVAGTYGIAIRRYVVASPKEVAGVLAAAKEEKVDALRVAWTGPLLIAEADTRAFAVANKLPDFWTFPIPVEKGGLLSYSPKLSEIAIRGAAIVDKILRGSNPAEIPFEYPTQYDLVINLKSARERGIVIPQSVLVRATRVIE